MPGRPHGSWFSYREAAVRVPQPPTPCMFLKGELKVAGSVPGGAHFGSPFWGPPRSPGMPLGVLEALRAAEPGQAFAGHGAAVFGGVAALSEAP